MALQNLDQKHLAFIFAQFAKDAYKDDSSPVFKLYGFEDDYQLLNKDEAYGHVVCKIGRAHV